MRQIDSALTEADITHLLALRSASVRHAIRPPVPTDVALRLADHGLVSARGGGVEITETGSRFLEARFLFCQALGCDGVLRRWELLSPMHAGMSLQDPKLESELADGLTRWVITCPKCAHRNILRGSEAPTMRSHYVLVEVLPPHAA